MKNADSEAHLERQLAAALKSEPEVWTHDCLPPEQIIALAERAVPEAKAVSHLAHLALCARCRREYAETVELIQLAEEVGALQAQAASPPAAKALSTSIFSAENAVPAPAEHAVPAAAGKEAPRPSFWQKWFAPGFGFALGAAAAGIVLFATWSVPARVQRSKILSLLKERDAQQMRADRMAQENRTLGRELASQQQRQGKAAQLAQEVERLNLQTKRQGIQVARLTEAETTLEQMPLPTPGWMLSRESRQVRGSGGAVAPAAQIALVRPVDVALEARKPVLECRPVSGATGYQISLEMEGADEEVPAPRPLSATRWQVTAPLSPGKVYLWAVTASHGSEQIRSQSARFYILSAAEQHTVAAARQQFARRPVVLGTVYARLGMWDQAAQQFQMALKTNPEQPVARRLLREIAEQRRVN